MLRKLATTLVLVAVVAGSLSAEAKNGGIARQIAMGGSQAGSGLVLNPFIMDDPALLLLNPAYQAMYKDYAWMNIGGGALNNLSTGNNGYGQQNAGLAFSFGRDWTFGAILSYDPSAVNTVGSLLSGRAATPPFPAVPAFVRRTGGSQTIPAVANVWEILAAYHMGSMDLGFAFTYGSSNSSGKNTVPAPGISSENEASSSLLGFRLGANFDLGSGSSFDASAALRLDKATDKVTVTPTPATPVDGEYSASATEIQVNLRGKFKMSNRVNFVPYGMFAILSAEPKEDNAPQTLASVPYFSEKVSGLAYAVGIGGEYRTPAFYLAGGLSVQSVRAKLEFTPPAPGITETYTGTYFALPVLNIGGEWWFTDWMAGRSGYYRSLGSTKYETEGVGGTGTSTESKSSFPNSFMLIGGINPATHDGLVTLGLGFRFGGFALDATVSEEALRRGLGLIGAQDNINTFGYITTSYNFGE
jgi:hypothetical protein